MTKSKSFDRNPKHRALYHALMESILENEDVMDKGVADKLKKRKLYDVDKDEDPPAGPGQGLKRWKTSKDVEPSKKAKSTDISKGTTKSQPKSTGDFPQLYLNDIKDMMLLVVQNMLFNLNGEDIKKLNISRPLTHKPGISDLEPYTTYSDPQGVIYLDKFERNSLMCSHELYKFSDGTLISVRNKLKDMANNLKMRWSVAGKKVAGELRKVCWWMRIWGRPSTASADNMTLSYLVLLFKGWYYDSDGCYVRLPSETSVMLRNRNEDVTPDGTAVHCMLCLLLKRQSH
ncbi:hypothetical protein Tco_0883772 [Tanacetum coccineum]